MLIESFLSNRSNPKRAERSPCVRNLRGLILGKHYIYGHYTLDGQLRYIGKGSGKRAWSKHSRTDSWRLAFPAARFGWAILADNLQEEEAWELEPVFIRYFREKGYDLANVAEGGRGIDAATVSATKTGRPNGLKGRVMPEEHRQKIAQARLASAAVKEAAPKVWESRRANGTASGFTTSKAKPVLCIETGVVYRTAKEAAEAVGGSDKHIQACCKGRRARHMKLTWAYQ